MAAPNVSTPRVESTRRHESQTILVVDDESGVRGVCTLALKRAGYKVISAEDGFAALRICLAAEYRIDLALLDCKMPNMSGRALLDCLASSNLVSRFILMSGFVENEFAGPELCGDRPYSFLRKPFTSSGLLEAVGRELGRNPDRRGPTRVENPPARKVA